MITISGWTKATSTGRKNRFLNAHDYILHVLISTILILLVLLYIDDYSPKNLINRFKRPI